MLSQDTIIAKVEQREESSSSRCQTNQFWLSQSVQWEKSKDKQKSEETFHELGSTKDEEEDTPEME